MTTPHGHDDDLPTAEVDARFADIVAGFATPTTDPVPRWSALEDVDDAPETEPVAPEEPARPPLSSRLLRSEPTPVDPVAHEVDPLDIEEHFVPEPPPPLPEVDRFTRLAWAALVGCVTPEGKLEHVQPVGADPKKFLPTDTEVYGTGAFLLAGSEMYRLAQREASK